MRCSDGREDETPRKAHWDADPNRGVYLPPKAGGVGLNVPILVFGTLSGALCGAATAGTRLAQASGLDETNWWAGLAVGAGEGFLIGFLASAAIGLVVGSITRACGARPPKASKSRNGDKE